MTAPKKRPRGRPKRAVKRDIHKQIRLTADEKRRFEAAAAPQDFSTWVRQLCETAIEAQRA